MINITLTDFIDYVSKVGTSRYTKVNQIHSRDVYHPAFDFWKPLREGFIKLNQKQYLPLLDSNGSCAIYGGRLIGGQVLLAMESVQTNGD